MNETTERKTLNISRYSSRRLYNTGAGEYVTVDDLAKHIRNGHDIKVTDKKSGEDITGQILLQIIADQEAESGSVLPTNVLTDIVRHYSSETRSLVPKFLSESFEMLKGHRKKISGTLLDQMANPLDPQKALNSMDAWREAQTDIVNSVISAWLPKDKRDNSSGENREPPSAEHTSQEKEASLASELDQLKVQMAEMQAKLENLQRD